MTVSKINSRASLDRSPKENWVDRAGGLPMYIRRIANHLHQEKGKTIGHSIAIAVNAVKKMCATGDVNWPGAQSVNAKSRAEACAAVASWERKKAGARVSKGDLGRKWTDTEFIEFLTGESVDTIEKCGTKDPDCGCSPAKKRRKMKDEKVSKGGNPFWDGDGLNGVGQPRGTNGRWVGLPGKSSFDRIGVWELEDGSFGVFAAEKGKKPRTPIKTFKTERAAKKFAAKEFEKDKGTAAGSRPPQPSRSDIAANRKKRKAAVPSSSSSGGADRLADLPTGSTVQVSSRKFKKHGDDAWAEDWMGDNPSTTRKDSAIQREINEGRKRGLTISVRPSAPKSDDVVSRSFSQWMGGDEKGARKTIREDRRARSRAEAESGRGRSLSGGFKAGDRVVLSGIRNKQFKDKEVEVVDVVGETLTIIMPNGDRRRVGKGSVTKIKKTFEEEFEELSKEIDTFFDPDNPDTEEFEVAGEIEKRDDEKQMVFGWCSIAKDKDGNEIVDKQGDVLDDIDQMENVAYDFVLHSRDGGEMHVRKGVSTLVESFVSTPEKWAAMGIPEGTLPIGWWVGFKVTDNEVWKSVKSGKYRMFSVHGSGTRKAYEE